MVVKRITSPVMLNGNSYQMLIIIIILQQWPTLVSKQIMHSVNRENVVVKKSWSRKSTKLNLAKYVYYENYEHQ